ncbi:MAG: hypothetical protein JMDDDDMK_00456 [Acidobacteria bacterium]|nr:hypothetical protein [Acidobacteriota bacterium]
MARAVYRHAHRIGEARFDGCPVFEATIGAREGDHGINLIEAANAMVVGVGDVNVNLIAVSGDARQSIEPRVRRIVRACRAVAGHRRHIAVGINSANRVIAGVGHVDSAQCVNRHSARAVESRCRTCAVNKSRRAVARKSRHVSAGVNFADAVVAGVGDVDVPRAVNRHALRVVELGEASLIVQKSGRSVARDSRHCAARVNGANAVVACVGHVNNIARPCGNARQIAESRC